LKIIYNIFIKILSLVNIYMARSMKKNHSKHHSRKHKKGGAGAPTNTKAPVFVPGQPPLPPGPVPPAPPAQPAVAPKIESSTQAQTIINDELTNLEGLINTVKEQRQTANNNISTYVESLKNSTTQVTQFSDMVKARLEELRAELQKTRDEVKEGNNKLTVDMQNKIKGLIGQVEGLKGTEFVKLNDDITGIKGALASIDSVQKNIEQNKAVAQGVAANQKAGFKYSKHTHKRKHHKGKKTNRRRR
jgi:hypothetical protein